MSTTRIEEPIAAPPHPRRLLHRTLDTFGWVAGAGVLLLLLTTACIETPQPKESETSAEARAAAVVNEVVGAVGSAVASATDQASGAVADAVASAAAFQLGASASADIQLTGANTEGVTVASQTTCLTATVTDSLDWIQNLTFRIEINCQNSQQGVIIQIDSAIQKNDEAPQVILSEEATTSCNDLVVTSRAFPGDWRTSILGFRHFFAKFLQTPDASSVQPGDELKVTTILRVSAILPPNGAAGDSIEVSGRHEVTVDSGATPRPCNDAPECAQDEDCPPRFFCEHSICQKHRPLIPNVTSITTDPSPLVPNQGFSFNIAIETPDGSLQPYEITITIAKPGITYTGVATPNQGLGSFTVGGLLNEPIISGADPNSVYVDLDRDATPGPRDANFTISEDLTDLIIDADGIVDGGDSNAAVDTMPGVTVNGHIFFGVLKAGPPGVYPGTVTFKTVDVTSGGRDDGVGLGPLTTTFNFTLDNGVFTLNQDGCPDDAAKTSPGLCGCGVNDESNGSDCDTGEAGRCEFGTLVCSAGTSECERKLGPGDEICNAIDDDCDGHIDEGAVTETPCDTGEAGVCADGRTHCLDPELCVRQTDPSGEACNGLDDDCDGHVDEGFSEIPCDTGEAGVCADGRTPCLDPDRCVRQTDPSDEACNGLDDDCDGHIDEGACQETSFSSFKGSFGLSPTPGKDTFKWQGELPSAGLAFDPASDGVTVTAVQNQQTISELHLGPGAGWKTSGDKWTFTDDGSLGGPGKDAFALKLNPKKQIFTMKGSTQKLDLATVSAGIITVEVSSGNDNVTDTQRWVANDKGTKVTTVKGGAFCGDGIKNGTEECDGAQAAACAGACRPDCTCVPPSDDVYVLPHFMDKAGTVSSTPFTLDTTIFATYTGGLAGTSGGKGAVVDIFLYDNAAGNPLQNNGQDVCNPCTRAIGGPGQPRKLSFAIDDALSATGAFDEVRGFAMARVTGDGRNVKLTATLSNSHTGPADLAVAAVDFLPIVPESLPPSGTPRIRTYVIPHLVEKSGRVSDGVAFTFDTAIFATYVGGIGGVEEGTDLGGGTRATIELYLYDQVTGQPLENGAGTATVCNPCTFAVGSAGQPRKRTISIDELIVAAGGFGASFDTVMGYGVVVVRGATDAVSVQGFVVNSHTSALDLSVFGFAPQEVSGETLPCP